MSAHTYVAVLKLPSSVPKIIVRGDAMVLGVEGSPLLASARAAAAILKGNLDILRDRQAKVKGGGMAATAARDEALVQVGRNMETLRSTVQQAADAAQDHGAEIITAAGMYVQKTRTINKPELEIVQGAISGKAIARAKARGRGTTYWWERSSDQLVWVGSDPTRTATTTFEGLTPGTTYYFRFKTLTRAGISDWSQVVAFMVK